MKRWWILLVLFALILRLGAAYYWQYRVIPARNPSASQDRDGPFFFGDSDSYWKLGRAVAFGRPYEFDEQRHWTVFRMPGYPILLAPLFLVGGETPPVFAARILNCLLGTLSVVLVALLAYTLFEDRRIAFVAALFAACDPCCLLQSVAVLSEAGFSVLLLIQMILYAVFCRKMERQKMERRETGARVSLFVPGVSPGVLLGVVWAAAVYFRPSWLYFAPFVFVVLLLYAVAQCPRSASVKTIATTALLAICVFSALMGPWWYRNYKVTGRFVPTTLQMGSSLYDGLSPTADGSSDMSFVDRFREEERASEKNAFPKDHFEYRLDRRMRASSLAWCREHPGQVARLAWIKFKRLWNVVPNEASFSSRSLRLVIFASYTPVLLLAFFGLWLIRKRVVVWSLLLLPACYITLLHVVFVSSLRYRTPAMLMLMIPAAAALVALYQRVTRGRTSGQGTQVPVEERLPRS